LVERETSVAYIKDLLEYYSLLSSFPNLHPCPEVNEVFEKLVAVCVQVKNESVIRSVSGRLSLQSARVLTPTRY
jgi:hypothetical protein